MTEREITKLASDLYDEGLRAADREKIAEKTDLSEKELECYKSVGQSWKYGCPIFDVPQEFFVHYPVASSSKKE